MLKLAKKFGFIVLLAFLLAACSKENKQKLEDVKKKVEERIDTLTKKDTTTSPRYECVLNPTKGNKVKGTLSIWRKGGDLYIQGEIIGLTEGKHGFHIHDKGDCSAPDASSAGDHFNPTGKQHGKMGKDSHMGDLENIKADNMGMAKVDMKLDADYWMLSGPNSIVGRSIVVHADEDDLKTQPSGNSGKRVACGVIEKAK